MSYDTPALAPLSRYIFVGAKGVLSTSLALGVVVTAAAQDQPSAPANV